MVVNPGEPAVSGGDRGEMNPSGGDHGKMNPSDATAAYASAGSIASTAPADVGANAAESIDMTLVTRMSRQDPEALAEFYDRWSSTVRGLVQRIVGEPADTDEVVEEVFWQVWQQAERFDMDRGRVPVWLMTIARSRALDRARARRRRRDEVSDTLDDGSSRLDQLPSAETPVDPGVMANQRDVVAKALEALPAEQRDVVLLAYFAGLSQVEIAERLGLPLGTVKTRTRLAFSKLRDSLAILQDFES